MSIERAKELLAKATGEIKSVDEHGDFRDSYAVGVDALHRGNARNKIKASAEPTLAAAIALAEAAGCKDCHGARVITVRMGVYDAEQEQCHCVADAAKAFAAFEALFPEA